MPANRFVNSDFGAKFFFRHRFVLLNCSHSKNVVNFRNALIIAVLDFGDVTSCKTRPKSLIKN